MRDASVANQGGARTPLSNKLNARMTIIELCCVTRYMADRIGSMNQTNAFSFL
jgi:hypothetical protein